MPVHKMTLENLQRCIWEEMIYDRKLNKPCLNVVTSMQCSQFEITWLADFHKLKKSYFFITLL